MTYTQSRAFVKTSLKRKFSVSVYRYSLAFKKSLFEHTCINKKEVHIPTSLTQRRENINCAKQRNAQQDIDFYNLKYVYHKNSHSTGLVIFM